MVSMIQQGGDWMFIRSACLVRSSEISPVDSHQELQLNPSHFDRRCGFVPGKVDHSEKYPTQPLAVALETLVLDSNGKIIRKMGSGWILQPTRIVHGPFGGC